MTTSRTGSKISRGLLPIIILAVAVLIALALKFSKVKPEPVVVPEKAWLVAIQKVEPSSYSPSLTLYGKVESLWSTTLTAAVSADIQTVEVIEGDEVRKGDLLLSLDDQDVRLQLLQREAELKEAEAAIVAEHRKHQNNLESLPRDKRLLALTRNEVSRLLGLVKKKISAKTALDSARQASERQAIALSSRQQAVDDHQTRLVQVEARHARAKALRDQALRELERCKVVAPFNGRISRLRVSPGKRARTGDPLVELYDIDALVVRAQVPGRYLSKIRAALENNVTLHAKGLIDGKAVNTKLRSMAGEVVSGSSGVDGLFEIQGNAADVQQGRFVQLDLKLPAQDSLIALPHEAIYGADRIYIVDTDNRMHAIQIKRMGEIRLSQGESRVLVQSPELSKGSHVVTTQLPNAINGLLLRIATDK